MFSTEKNAGDLLSLVNAQDSLEQVFSSFELIPSAVALLDTGGVIEYVNPVFLSMGCYSNKNEAIGKKYSSFTDDAGAIKLAGDIIPVLLSGGVWTGEFYQKKANGTFYISYMICSLIGGKSERKHLLFNFYDVTERREGESALRISDELLNMVLKNTDIGTWELDILKNKWMFSKPFLDFLGYSAGEIREDVSFWEGLMHPDDLPKVSAALMSHLQARTPLFECEYRLKSKSGEWKWVAVRGKIMTWSPGGKPSRILGVYNNIHEARKNGESLKELENRYRLVTENTSEGVWIIDENGYTTYVNPAMCEILGYKPNEMIGKTLGSYISKNSAQEYSAHISNIRQGIREHKELALTGRDGRIVYASFETAPLIDEQGTYMGALSVISDETPRNEMEKKIKEYEGGYEEAKRMYGLLADGINGGAYVAELNGIISEITSGIVKNFGLEEKDLVGTRLQGYVHPEDLPAFCAGYDKAVAGSRESFAFRVINKRGGVYHVRLTPGIFERTDGNKRLLCVLEDITQTRKAEELTKQYAEKLKESEERNQKLANTVKEAAQIERRYHQLMEVALEGLWIIDETSNTSCVNYKWLRCLDTQ